MLLHTFFQPGLAINSYLVGDADKKQAVMIDPARDVEPYLDYAKQAGLEISDIVETHVHADFISGSKELKHRLQNKPVIHCSALGGAQWIPSYADKHVMDGYEIHVGTVRLKALHTPGHSPEHVIWLCYDTTCCNDAPCLAFTGDFLFVGSVGRPDLLGEYATKEMVRDLYDSVFVKLSKFPDYLEIFPAHGAGSLCGKILNARPSSTLGYERLSNPFLVPQSIEKWSEWAVQDLPASPRNFQRIKKMNAKGARLLSEEGTGDEQPSLVVDVRNPELFAKAHIQHSLNIPRGASFCNWAGSVIAEDIPIELVVENLEQLSETIKDLKLIGLDRISRHIIWDDGQTAEEFPIESTPLATVETVEKKLESLGKSIYVLDVRTPSEWKAGHIEGAHLIQLAQLKENMHQLPKEAFIYTICGSGLRGSVAASLLLKYDYPHVANIAGGMNAWKKAGYALASNPPTPPSPGSTCS